MDLTEDSFRALARSSPWRFTTLHLTHRSSDGGPVEAWLRRPGWLKVRDRERVRIETGVPYTRTVLSIGDDGASTEVDQALLAPGEVVPMRRPDGLVARRPDDWRIEYDDPMYENYQWVAMLDPVELSHHVRIDGLREDVLSGRPIWWARVVPEAGYDPRCGCCPLLWSRISEDMEYGEDRPGPVPDYPDAYEVALDVGTGVVVALTPVGGDRDDLGFDVEIHDVDVPAEVAAAW